MSAARHGAAVALLAAIAVLSPPAVRADGAAPAAAPAFRVERLEPRLFRITGTAAGGVLVWVGDTGLLLIDAGDPKEADALARVVDSLSTLPVRFVVNTHYHEDHLGLNPRYRARGAEIVAHANLRAQAIKDTVVRDFDNWHRKPAPAAALPTLTFRDSLTLWLDGAAIQLFHVPRAHTDGDLMTRFPGDVVHLGDVYEQGAPPFVDLWAGGTLDGMIAALDLGVAGTTPRTRFVPGHGAVSTRAEIDAYRAMLVTIRDRALAAVAAKTGFDAFLATKPAAEFADRLGGEGAARQVAALAYFGLNGLRK